MRWRTASTYSGSGARPSSGLMVVRTRRAPVTVMKAPMAMPAQASTSRPVACCTSAQARMMPVVMTSFLESAAAASSGSESIRRPSLRLKASIQSFTSIEPTRIATKSGLNLVGSGSMSLS